MICIINHHHHQKTTTAKTKTDIAVVAATAAAAAAAAAATSGVTNDRGGKLGGRQRRWMEWREGENNHLQILGKSSIPVHDCSRITILLQSSDLLVANPLFVDFF